MWAQYLEARPIGWKEDLRTPYQLRAAGMKKSGEDIFQSLSQMKKWDRDVAEEDKMRASLSRSVFGAMLEGASPKR